LNAVRHLGDKEGKGFRSVDRADSKGAAQIRSYNRARAWPPESVQTPVLGENNHVLTSAHGKTQRTRGKKNES